MAFEQGTPKDNPTEKVTVRLYGGCPDAGRQEGIGDGLSVSRRLGRDLRVTQG